MTTDTPPLTTHPDYLALLRAVCIDPDDDTPRLVLVDWLEERGEEGPAQQIRFGCANPLKVWWCTHTADDGRVCRSKTGVVNCPNCVSLWHLGMPDCILGGRSITYQASRGLPFRVNGDLADLVRHRAAIFAAAPITDVVVEDKHPSSSGTWSVEGGHWSFGKSRQLPPAVFREVLKLVPRSSGGNSHHAHFGGPPSANSALSAACVRLGRRAAGLEG